MGAQGSFGSSCFETKNHSTAVAGPFGMQQMLLAAACLLVLVQAERHNEDAETYSLNAMQLAAVKEKKNLAASEQEAEMDVAENEYETEQTQSYNNEVGTIMSDLGD